MTVCTALCIQLAAIASADALPSFEHWLMVPSVAGGGRSPLRTDPIEYQIVMGTWAAPKSGDVVTRGDGQTRTWSTATPTTDGWIEDDGLAGGYVFATTRSESPAIAILDAAGHSMVYVNGEPRMGDPYAYGYLQLPVELKAGENTFLFRVDRGRVKARLVEPKSDVYFNIGDPTLPDQVVGETERMLGAVVLVNATRDAVPAGKLKIRSEFAGGTDETDVPGILPLTIRKVPIAIAAQPTLPASERPLKLELIAPNGSVADTADFPMRVAAKEDWRRITFTSGIDGSVQSYCMWPPAAGAESGDPNQLPGLIFTVHGASVEATNQIKAYTPKPWAYIVAPTNRRPYGFDWEDWGRLDALEVWDHFLAHHKTDELRRWLTGHSMGGHGTWQLGGHFPDRFAAIAPCSGWVSFFSYANQKEFHPVQGDTKIAELLRRATNPSDTLGLSNNWKHYGVYVLHGDADDNVPVTEARTMRERLGQFHTDFCYYEKPGGGHWWDNTAVDWPPLMEFIKARARKPASEVREIDFTTVNPAISASSAWVWIMQQERRLLPSRIRVRAIPDERRFIATTENITAFAVASLFDQLGRNNWKDFNSEYVQQHIWRSAQIDGQEVQMPSIDELGVAWPHLILFPLVRENGVWKYARDPSYFAGQVVGGGPAGLFKLAFARNMVFVLGTSGDADEDRWARSKARYDAEQWYYRGNGAVDVVADTELERFEIESRSRHSKILYGNVSMNAATETLLKDCPIRVSTAAVEVGERRIEADSLACLCLCPPVRDDRDSSVAIIAPTGPIGMRLCDRLPYFVSGVAYPDVTVLSPDVLMKGLPGVVATGFFGNDWTVENGEFGFAE